MIHVPKTKDKKSKLISPIALNFDYNFSQLKEVYV